VRSKGAFQTLNRARAIFAIDFDETGQAHRATPARDLEQLALGHHAYAPMQGLKQHRNVVVRLMIRHDDEGLAPRRALQAFDFQLDLRLLEQDPGPREQPLIADLGRQLARDAFDQRRDGNACGLDDGVSQVAERHGAEY
jgi:hypothetical protein